MRVRRTTLNVVCVLYLLALCYLMYEMALGPDEDERRLRRLHFRFRFYQDIAERFGRLGLEAEKEYHATLESRRTI